MGGLRICKDPVAKTPFFIKKISANIYTIEELCYYIYHNFPLIDDTLMNETLFSWMEQELSLGRYAGILRQNVAAGASYRKLASTLLDLAGYCSKDELRRLFSQVDVKNTRPGSQTLKTIGDRMLENHKYTKAIREYNSILHLRSRDSQSDEFLSSVYHNMGVAYAQLFLYDEAAKCFAAAYEKQPDASSRELYLAAVKLGGAPIEDFLDEDDEHVGETLERLVKEAAEDETVKRLHALKAMKDSGDMEGYQKALQTLLHEQKKKAGKYISV